jgi:hypothetical protein
MIEKNNKDEIDILSLFSLIGKKTNSLLVLIINFFISFFNLIISILYLVKRNYLILLISLIIGLLTGYFYEKNLYVSQYQTTLTLSPNFGSTYYLYEEIKFYQTLIVQKDFEKLNVYLNLDSADAKFLTSISIEPYKNESLNLKNFKRLLSTADSVTALTLSYGKFEDKIPFDLYKLHVITLGLNSKNVPIEIEKIIIESVENNIYFKNKKETFIENLKIKKEYVLASIQKLDTLLFGDKKNLNSENLGTTIVLDKNQNENIDLQLFDRYTDLRNELVEINFQFKDKENVINTIDSFNELGVNVSDKNYILYGGLFLFFIMLLVLIFYHIYILSPNLNFKKLDY